MNDEGNRSAGLLTPSLSPATGIAPLYSIGTGYLLGVFGGPIAAGLIMAINARRLGRLAQDAWMFAMIFVLSGVVLLVAFDHPDLFTIEWEGAEPRDARRLLLSGLGLLTTGLFHLKYRTYYRGMAMSGLESPTPWKTGIAVLVIAIALQFAFLFALSYARLFWSSLVAGTVEGIQ